MFLIILTGSSNAYRHSVSVPKFGYLLYLNDTYLSTQFHSVTITKATVDIM